MTATRRDDLPTSQKQEEDNHKKRGGVEDIDVIFILCDLLVSTEL